MSGLSGSDHDALLAALLGLAPAPPPPVLQAAPPPPPPAALTLPHVAGRAPTQQRLQRLAEYAAAQEAARAELPEGWLEAQGLEVVHTQASRLAEHLERPHQCGTLHPHSLTRLEGLYRPVDLVPVLVDGPNAAACQAHGVALLERLCAEAQDRGLTLGPRVGARFARPPVQEAIGAALGARVVALVCGEDPACGPEHLRLTLVYAPSPTPDPARWTVLRHIHPEALPPRRAAARAALLAVAMIAQGRAGDTLDLRGLEALLGEPGG